jgi:hypothetical protein
MKRGWAHGALLAVIAVIAACGTGAEGDAATSPPIGFEESQAALCASFGAMLRAVGNPDTGTGSALSTSLDAAVEAGDPAAAERAATGIRAELEVSRQEAGRSGGWAPARPTAVAMDALLAAFEAMTAAKVARAAGTPGAIDPQVAFEQAGGPVAWTALLAELRGLQLPERATWAPCRAFSGTP